MNDCSGECGGKKTLDECGVCDGNGINWEKGECNCRGEVVDCFGVCATGICEDSCGVCNGTGIHFDLGYCNCFN